MLGLSTLPSGAVLSIRQVTVDEQEASITPVLGAFGTVLSDFKPGARTVTPALDSIQLEQTTIGTVTGISGGRVVLAQPAPAGGVTVQLSNDCAGNVQIVPAALTIPEGQSAGEFTITGIGVLAENVPLTPALLRLDPMFDPLRNDPRFQKLVEQFPSQNSK
jgi:hypothetical protein